MATTSVNVSIVAASDNSLLKRYSAAVPLKSAAAAVADRSKKDAVVSIVSKTQADTKQSWRIPFSEELDAKKEPRYDTTVLSLLQLPPSSNQLRMITAHTPAHVSVSDTQSENAHSLWLHQSSSYNDPFTTHHLLSTKSSVVGVEQLLEPHQVLLASSNGEVKRLQLNADSPSITASHNVASLSRPITQCRLARDRSAGAVVLGGQGTLAAVLNIETGQLSWKAKSLGNDSLNMTIPIWDKDSTWLHQSQSLFGVSTAYGQLRVYDTRTSQRKPVTNYELQEVLAKDESVGHHQRMTRRDNLFSLNRIVSNQWHAGSGHGFIVGSNKGHLYSIDTRVSSDASANRVCYRLKGFQGAIRDIQILDTHPVLAACSLDRHIRVFDIVNYAPSATVYSKLPLSCLVFLPEPVSPTKPKMTDEDEESSSDSVEADWDQLEQVSETGKGKTKGKTTEKTKEKPKEKRGGPSKLPPSKRQKKE
eukprot:TRINITY_DN5771_c0_g1_i1.p1 TRINITY_DN5771_c0_g1~~TRINITY_DN5771_c0_g1_i1.p1  ORF type:complete len:476 (-),score=58.56 TRINITY_DN5771_c0_g1_i1:26-1453(-)